LALDQAWREGRIQSGQTVMLLALETSKWIYSGVVVKWSAATPN
jgi:3-oxoacyl-[acyl-carrier-protein] synthase-3